MANNSIVITNGRTAHNWNSGIEGLSEGDGFGVSKVGLGDEGTVETGDGLKVGDADAAWVAEIVGKEESDITKTVPESWSAVKISPLAAS